ncbi:MAG: TIGR04190 family B12-binding domain/radical SAM domain protein [Chloroflexi bacterium]|nr:TIGR04190 family B12-binding domain/radical SAM domain protein [Chloroflexota bacterium]
MSLDLVLFHAPSVYDFRKKTILHGPVSDLIPPSPVFEMYPIGLTSIAEYLGNAGYQVRIVNLAVRMMNDANFDVEGMIKRLKSPVYGIDLHWLVHCHGSVEIARLVKKHHPESKLVFGGLSSSYFYKELLQYPEIDYVLRGDSTEEPFRQLMECLKDGQSVETVPNLVWKDSSGNLRENPFTNVPTNIDNLMVKHYNRVVRSVIKYRDLASYVPFKGWLRYPIMAVFTCRGCSENCVICGGSASTFRDFYNRGKPVFRSPEVVLRDIRQVKNLSAGPIFLLGDLRQPGEDYGYKVLELIEKEKVKNQFMLEFFNPAPKQFIRRMGVACPRFCLEMSPESHDPAVRIPSGRNYSNQELEDTIQNALDAGCDRMDIYFLIGLPNQTAQSALDSVEYCGYLLEKFKGDKRLALFTSPLSPFLDPGSLGFEYPERYGYRKLCRTLEEHRQALLAPSWKYSLNYETEWMDRHQIAETAYEAILRLNSLKAKYGTISKKLAKIGEERIKRARDLMHRIDDLLKTGDYEKQLPSLKEGIDRMNIFPISEKKQLELPVGLVKLKFWRALFAG